MRMRTLVVLCLCAAVGCSESEDPAPVDDIADEGELPPDGGEPDPPPDLATDVPAGEVRAGIIEDSAALLPGVKADGRIGDIKFVNAVAAYVIEAPGLARGGYRRHGGNVVDALPVGPGQGAEGDAHGEIWHTWNLHAFEPAEVEIVSDGRDGEAVVRFVGGVRRFDWAWSFLAGILGGVPTELDVTVEYRMLPDTPALRRTVSLSNPGKDTVQIPVPMTFSNQGDGMTTWVRGFGFDFEGGTVDAITLSGRDVGVGLVAPAGFDVILDYSDVMVSAEAPIVIPAGETVTMEYVHLVVPGGAAGIDAAVARHLGRDADVASRLEGIVTLPATADPLRSWVAVRQDGAPFAVAPVDAEGSFALDVPAGSYDVRAFAREHAGTESLKVDAGDGPVSLAIEAAGTVHVTVSDPAGKPVEARVTLRAEGDTPSAHAPHDVRIAAKGEWDWGSYGHVNSVGYAINGKVSLAVPAGTYTVLGSRGFSYELDQAEIEVEAGGSVDVALELERVVDTTGWVSGDFHIHALRSPDSGTPYPVRAKQSVAEDLDLPILTEHVQVGGLDPVAGELGLDSVIGLSAQEVTTFEYGHFNAFPLAEDPDAYNYGAVFPYDKRPAELFAAIRDQSEGDEVIQVNHPRGGGFGSYFSWVGLKAKDLSVHNEEEWATDFDAIEVFNGSCGGGDTLTDWIAMTNAGWAKTLASGSDSHTEDDPIGMPRNWIRLKPEEVRDDPETLVAAVRQRRLFVSCGPFVRFETADDGIGLGGLAAVDDAGEIAFRVVVEAPSWMALTEARLVRNGAVIDVVPIEEPAGGVRLDIALSDAPVSDAWYAVDVVGSGNLLPVHKSGPPRAYTNPIEVDADGDGSWTPPGLGSAR